MALNIPGTQIYAGRYHHGNIKTPDLFQEAGKTEPSKARIPRRYGKVISDHLLQDRRRFCRSEQRKNMAVAKRWKLCGRDKTG